MLHSFPKMFRAILFCALFSDVLSLSRNFFFSQVGSGTTSAAVPKLGKRSTAKDVAEYLKQKDNLATYVDEPTATAIVTGGNTGIGGVTVSTIVQQTSMNVVLCTRDVEAGENLLKTSVPEEYHSRVHIQQLDLSDMRSVQSASEEIKSALNEKGWQLQLLINNAGVMSPPNKLETKQGLELQFGVNHVGHFMLTRLLIPDMEQSNGRVVTVSSTAQSFGEATNWGGLEHSVPYSAWASYGQSKLANVMFAKALQDRLILRQISGNMKSVCLHPGVIGTNLWQYTPSVVQRFSGVFADKTVEQGAATSIFCALAKDVVPGGYYNDCRISSPKGVTHNEKIREDLWRLTEDIIMENGVELPEI